MSQYLDFVFQDKDVIGEKCKIVQIERSAFFQHMLHLGKGDEKHSALSGGDECEGIFRATGEEKRCTEAVSMPEDVNGQGVAASSILLYGQCTIQNKSDGVAGFAFFDHDGVFLVGFLYAVCEVQDSVDFFFTHIFE